MLQQVGMGSWEGEEERRGTSGGEMRVETESGLVLEHHKGSPANIH